MYLCVGGGSSSPLWLFKLWILLTCICTLNMVPKHSFVHKKQYQTSAMPLWLKARRIIATETSCGTEVSNDVVVSGYSEGGYGAVAIAEVCIAVTFHGNKLAASNIPVHLSLLHPYPLLIGTGT